VIWFPRAWVALQTRKRAGEDPLPLKEPGVSLGGRGSLHDPRLGVRNSSCAAETSSLNNLSALITPVKGLGRRLQQFFFVLA
jgi:hypothetical protein